MLGHKLIYVVVVAVIHAVNVSKPSAPTCPLAITRPTVSEPSNAGNQISRVEAIAEVEVLHLYLMLTGLDAHRQVLVFADGAKGGVVLDPAQHTYATLVVSISLLLMGRAPGCANTAGAMFL